MTRISITFLATALLGCSSAPKHASAPEPTDPATVPIAGSSIDAVPPAPTPTPDSRLGLSKTSVFEVPDPPVTAYTKSEPGGNARLARSFPGAPPLIPHQITDFLPITIAENGCLACHELGPAGGPEDPTPLPPSHATDLRNAPDVVGTAVVGARWRCVACHLPQADAPPLVGSSFAR